MESQLVPAGNFFASGGRGLCARFVAIALMALVAPLGLQALWLFQSQSEWEAAVEIERLEGSVVWAWRLDSRIQEKQYPCYRAPSWLVPGDAFVEGVYLVNCQDPQIDQKLACLKSFRRLRTLELGNSGITDNTLQHLSGRMRLTWLDLHDTPITDEGLHRLPAFGRLESLNLYNTRITDASLPRLATFTRLKRINLGGTQVTTRGLAYLREQLPAVRIDLEPGSSS